MKNVFYLVIAALMLAGWNFRLDLQASYLTKVEAEKILGQDAQLTDSASTKANNISTFKSTFTADSKDPNTGKLGAIYFMIEHYKEVASAKETYSSLKASNQNNPGYKIVNDLGDEAWFHSDGKNFYLIIVRKGDRMFRLKVNKVTSKTSIEAFDETARSIANKL